MVSLLKDYGVQIGQWDSYSFNVFHWFVHLSLTNLEKTVRCSSVVVKVYGDEVKCPILYSENRFGLTPLEASVINGAFLYFDHLSNIQGLLRIPLPLDLSRGSSYGLNASVLQNLEDSSRHYYDVLLFENGLGGLIEPVEAFWLFMTELHTKILAGDKAAASATPGYQEYVSSCQDHIIMQDAYNLFTKICSHHKCKMFLGKLKVEKKCVGKGKALRTKLADKKLKNTLSV
ncbi:hypothetical protein CAPTEDRAFT_215599 [Capitella teleta]|uniref:Uncharacterized protein n=1 Tax=Capitella teleta TaxID=283909 RepID=R7V5H9_CAPTE|nr:hypothetical protein CAPTEDRAFT_215599 [Capitella teleta]|eukprot:ELU11045.1 hypothetical protein CAPTEDRAFT_215599 [Capitella teleta]